MLKEKNAFFCQSSQVPVILIKVWWLAATLFIYFCINRADRKYLYIQLVKHHSGPYCFRSVKGLLWGALQSSNSGLPCRKPTQCYLDQLTVILKISGGRETPRRTCIRLREKMSKEKAGRQRKENQQCSVGGWVAYLVGR
jgi:hypothetical protein